MTTACLRGCTVVRTNDDGEQVRVPREATSGLLCARCRSRLEDRLSDVLEYQRVLDEFREPRSSPDDGKPRGKRAASPAPVNLAVTAVEDPRTMHRWRRRRDGEMRVEGPMYIRGILGSWVWLVAEQRHLSTASVPTIAGSVGTLAAQLDWICEQDWVLDLDDELDEVHRLLGTLVGEVRPKPVGPCPVTLDDGEPCGWMLWPPRSGTTVTCTRCGSSWTQEQLLILAAAIEEDKYVPIADAAEAIGRPHRTIRTWIAQGRVDSRRHPDTGVLVVDAGAVQRIHQNAERRNRARAS